MKRVLNSGAIKVLSVLGREADILDRADRMVRLSKGVDAVVTDGERLEAINSHFTGLTSLVLFKFEMKIPNNTLKLFSRAQLGTFEDKGKQRDLEAYLPPNFYKRGPLGFNLLDGKDANELNTKFNNFYTASMNFYNKLLERGVCPEQARLILPEGMFSTVDWTITAQDLIKFIEANYSISPEVYGYCGTLVLYLEESLPLVTKWLKQNRWNEFLQL